MSFASINGVVLHYRLQGAKDAPPLVLVNSLGTSLDIWDDVADSLAPQFHVLTYDKRGHGLSSAPSGPYTLDDHVSDLLGLVTYCGIEKFNYCGISIGGMIGMRLAALHPDRLLRIVLCDTGAIIGTASMWNERIAQVDKGGMTAVADAIMARWVAPDFEAAHPADYEGWRNMVLRGSPAGYVASCAAIRDADLTGDLPRISLPTLVIAGEHDVPTPPSSVRKLAASIAARFELIAGAGHVPAIEQPQFLADLIREHLSEVVHD